MTGRGRSLLPAIQVLGAMCCPGAVLLPIEDRPQDPLIHAIAPEDGSRAVINPPSMVFWYTSKAATYTVEMSTRERFDAEVITATTELPFYNHSGVLAEGLWYWRYVYTTAEGGRSLCSRTRRFTVTDESIPFPVPPLRTILEQLPAHPRVYTPPRDLEAFRARRLDAAATAYVRMTRAAESVMDTTPATPALGELTDALRQRRGLAFWGADGQWRLCSEARPSTLEHASNATRDLALLYLITAERRYAEAAKVRLLWQANFRVDAHQEDRAHHDTVHCYEYGLQRMASAYDSICDVLSAEERAAVLASVEYHGNAAYRKLRYKRRIHLKYQTSHAQQDMHELLTTALAVAKDLPAAEDWLSYLIPQYVNRLAWGKDDGGYSEGHYYNYKWHGMLRCAAALRNATGIDLFRKPRFANAGRFWLYCMSLNYWWAHFGDTFSLHSPLSGSSNDRDGANFLASVYQDRYVKWWADQIDSRLQNPLWYLSDETLTPKPPVDIPQAVMFPDVGWMSAYDELWRHDSTRLFFKSSPWGSHSHSHEDQNSFIIHAFGEALAIDKGYYGYYGDDYHRLICRASRSHNTILVDGEGQGRGIQYAGRITEFFDGKTAAFVIGDATAAYGGRLTAFLRAVLFIRPNTFVVYDQLEADEPRQFSWQLNAFHQMQLDPGAQSVTIAEGDVRLDARHLLPAGMRYRQSNQREYPLKSRYSEVFPEMWTCWCEPAATSANLRVLTVLEAHKAASGGSIENLRAVEEDGLVGLCCDVGDDSLTVLFQRDLRAPRMSAHGGIRTDASSVIVRRQRRTRQYLRHIVVGGTFLGVDGEVKLQSDVRGSEESTPRHAAGRASASSVPLVLTDAAGPYRVPLEHAVDSWGSHFYFATLTPREPGMYRLAIPAPEAEVIVEDKWDPARSSRGENVELREQCLLILKSRKALTDVPLTGTMRESYRGRILNLVQNGNFEAGIPDFVPRGWWLRHFSTGDLSYGYWCEDGPAEGRACLKLVRERGKIRVYSRWIDVRKPGRYVFEFKAKATCRGAVLNTSWSSQAITVRVEPSTDWRQYRVERDLTPHTACIHCIFDEAEGPEQTLWVDDLKFGPVVE